MKTEETNSYKQLSQLVGRRVEVRKGDRIGPHLDSKGKPLSDEDHKGEYEDHLTWFAGQVPVGTRGTVISMHGNTHLAIISWDGIDPMHGVIFGLGKYDLDSGSVVVLDEEQGIENNK